MKTPRIGPAIALAPLLALAAGAQAQEAGAWEMHGPPASASSVSREQVVSAVMWARAQGWRPAAEASRFDEGPGPGDRQRRARATSTRMATAAAGRDSSRSRRPTGKDARPTAQAADERPDLQERERERMAAWDGTLTASATPRPLPAGALASGTETAGVAVPSPVSASAGPIDDGSAPRGGSPAPQDDVPRAPLAPGRDLAIASPVRPGLADGGLPGSGDAVPAPEPALPPDEPEAVAPNAAVATAADDEGAASTRPVEPQPTMQASDLAPSSR